MSAHAEWNRAGEVQQGQIGTDAVGDRLGQLTTGSSGPGLGTSKTGERRYLIDLWRRSPKRSSKAALVCDAGTWATTVRSVLKQQARSDPALFAGTTLQLEMVKVERLPRESLVLDRRCREQEQASVAVRVIRGQQSAKRRMVGHQRSGPQAIAGGIRARFYRMSVPLLLM